MAQADKETTTTAGVGCCEDDKMKEDSSCVSQDDAIDKHNIG